jgi:hypothetical protein
MAFILRTWGCCNPDCHKVFESGEAAPHCPKCRCARTQWVPSGGHIKHGATTHADQTLRSVANRFGLTNLKSARQGEAAHPGIQQAKAAGGKDYFGIPWSPHGPTAGFAKEQPTAKVTAPLGGRFKAPKGGRGIPTDVVARDNRKIPL